MKQVNRLRAILIHSEYKSGDCSIVATDIMRRYLKDFPSVIEKGTCKKKGCASKTFEFNLPIVGLNEEELDGKIINLEKAVMANFPTENICRKCRQPYHTYERTCGDHLFIEVVLHI